MAEIMETYVSVACFFMFVALLVIAAVSDVVHYVIPNFVPAGLILLFPVAVALSNSPVVWSSHLAAAVLVFAVGFAAHRLRLFGGGDVKLWTAAGLWTGLETLPIHLALTALVGGGLALFLQILRLPRVRNIVGRVVAAGPGAPPRLLQGGAPVPYGVAIAVATYFAAQHWMTFWGTVAP